MVVAPRHLVNLGVRGGSKLGRMRDTLQFPDGFLFGASISAYQTEGGNTNSDWWWWEHIESTPSREPSGDACDFYHRYREDIAMLAGFGLNSFRFGIEWARMAYACPLNEPQGLGSSGWLLGISPPGHTDDRDGAQRAVDNLLEAHRLGAAAIRARAGIPTGVTLALPDLQYEDGAQPGASSLEVESRVSDWFLEMARQDDFIGVQTYTRFRYGPEGARSPGHDWSDITREMSETDQTTQMGYEYYPQALGGAIRRAHRSC